MFGFLNVYKPKGITSHDVISVLRRVTKIKQIGHTGTLDPFAEGVLPVCIGKATRLIEYLGDDKAYTGVVQLGKATTTYDIEGDVVSVSKKSVSEEDILSTLDIFTGEIEQKPPIYSAIKVNGKKLYEYARKGEKIEIKPRKVNIKKLELLEYNKALNTIKIHIECSKGTYIRSLANDLGEKLGTYGYLTSLVRTKAGKFMINDSVDLNKINTIEDAEKYIQNPINYLDYPVYRINDNEYNLISNGNSLCIDMPDGTTIITYKDKISAVGNVLNSNFKCSKVFT